MLRRSASDIAPPLAPKQACCTRWRSCWSSCCCGSGSLTSGLVCRRRRSAATPKPFTSRGVLRFWRRKLQLRRAVRGADRVAVERNRPEPLRARGDLIAPGVDLLHLQAVMRVDVLHANRLLERFEVKQLVEVGDQSAGGGF